MENCFNTISYLEILEKKREKAGLEFAFYLGGHEESNCGLMEVNAYAASALHCPAACWSVRINVCCLLRRWRVMVEGDKTEDNTEDLQGLVSFSPVVTGGWRWVTVEVTCLSPWLIGAATGSSFSSVSLFSYSIPSLFSNAGHVTVFYFDKTFSFLVFIHSKSLEFWFKVSDFFALELLFFSSLEFLKVFFKFNFT